MLVFLCGYASLSRVAPPEPDSLDKLDPKFLVGLDPKSLGCGFGPRFLAGFAGPRFLGHSLPLSLCSSLALSNVTPRGGTFPPLPTPNSAHTKRGARA